MQLSKHHTITKIVLSALLISGIPSSARADKNEDIIYIGTMCVGVIVSLITKYLIIPAYFEPKSKTSDDDSSDKPHNKPNNKSVTTLKDIAGTIPPDIIDFLHQLKEAPQFKRFGINPPKGLLLVGPPGTGKTLLARAIAGEAGYEFIDASGSQFIEVFVGRGAARVRELFDEARVLAAKSGKRVVIFIDELDALGSRERADYGTSETERTVCELLNQIDGFNQDSNIFVIAATNRPENIDPALRRSGRLTREILVPNPDEETRKAVLELYLNKLPADARDNRIDAAELARRSDGLNNADLQESVRWAAQLAARQGDTCVTQNHLQTSVEELKRQQATERKNKDGIAHFLRGSKIG